jgi:oligopeptide/dipeptide ABC transporter ATP-binding protein
MTEARSRPLLDVRDLTVEFARGRQRFHPVRGVTFRVSAGQRIALVGESGSGKSLTAFALMRLIRPPGRIAGGEIVLNGRDLVGLSEREMERIRGRDIAMVYQSPLSALNPIRRVGDQIAEALLAHERIGSRAARERAVSLLDKVGIAEPEQRFSSYPHQLSGGMRQRVVIAMAMSTNPALLVADEPTTALDVTTQARVMAALSELAEERGTAVVLITHDLAVAARFCSDIRVMYAGRIVEAAAAARFYSEPVHPYSEALLESIIRKDADVTTAVRSITGQQPTPSDLPAGCPFHPRCRYALDLCRTATPEPVLLGSRAEVMAECHLAGERFASGHTEPAGR